jgi:GNAT superfamily N-acetyltransferase
MNETSAGTDLLVRPYDDRDEAEVLDLIRGSLGGGPAGRRPPEYFRWKHLANPFGRSFMIVAEADGRIIGFRALMRWRFRSGDREVSAVRPEARGRGVFSRLTRTALDSLHGEVDLVFNTPNANSLPGYLKMGWRVTGEIPVSVRVRKPARFLGGKLRRGREPSSPSERPRVDAPSAADALRDEREVAALLERAERPGPGWSTPRSVEFLRWRYGDAPLLDYHAATVERDGGLAGLAFFRLRAEGSLWGLSVGEVIVPPGDVDTARALLRAARRAADVAYVAATFPAGSAAARAHRGPTTLRAPRGMTFVVNPLRSDLDPDPTALSSWALSTGDVEVF